MSDTVILSGLEASNALYDSLHARIDALKSKQITPGLAAILVGENPASQIYIRNKTKKFDSLGLKSEIYRLEEGISEEELLRLIDQINNYDFIENFNIIKFYPSKIVVKLEKTEFLGKTIQNNKYFFIGSNGKFIDFEKFKEKVNLPTVYGKFTPEQFLRFNKIIKNIDLDYNSIHEIFFYPSGRADIKTKNNLLIKFPKENMKEAIIVANKIINNKNYINNVIDLRVPNQLILSNE